MPAPQARVAHTHCAARVREFLKANDTAFLVIFAHWCSACSQLMPEIARLASSADVPIGIANADMLPDSFLQGELFDVQYFPLILQKSTHGLREASRADLQTRARSAPSPASSK